MAGDAWLALSRPDSAKDVWTQALHATPTDSIELRGESLRRLARLAESQGQGGTALRMWRDLRDLIPDDREATGRIEQLEIDR